MMYIINNVDKKIDKCVVWNIMSCVLPVMN